MATGWVYDSVDPKSLKNHLVNVAIYGTQELDKEILESVKSHGILEPIRCLRNRTIISGHRRRQHAIAAKLKEVPVLIYRGEMSEPEQVIQVVESNRQREKTVEQRAREYERLKEAKAALAAEREKAGLKRGAVPAPAKLPERENKANIEENGESAEAAAAEVGMSRHTAEKAAEVVHKIDELESAGESEKAADLRETLNTQSVSAAHRAATAEAESAPVMDEFGPVADSLAEAFSHAKDFTSIKSKLGSVLSQLFDLQQTPAGKQINYQAIEKLIRDAQHAVKFAQPFVECPVCQRKAKKCETCSGLRWITEPTWKRCRTKEMEAWLKAR